MYPFVVRTRRNGRTYEYIHLCQSVWKNGRSTRRSVLSLGRKDVLEPHLDRIYELCRGQRPAASAEPVPRSSRRLGPFLLLRSLWQQLALDRCLGPVSDRALALVLNRLTRPASEHALADWLAVHFVCDRRGRRFAPAFRCEEERLASRSPRVRVKAFQLQRWHRALDALLERKQRLEEHLFDRFRHLFALQCDLVFYDLASTWFEGPGPDGLARHGYSRDKRPGNRQVLLGVAMIDGLPLAHTVFEGNRRDCTTVREVVEDLRVRFGLGRFVLVGDRGMRSESGLEGLREGGSGYLMAVQGRRNPAMDAALEAAREGAWEPCVGADGKPQADGSQVQEVTGEGAARRRFLVHSPERERHERELREQAREKVRKRLERLQERVREGEFLRAARKELGERGAPEGEAAKEERERRERELAANEAGAAAGRILHAAHGQRYWDWRLAGDGRLEYFASAGYAREVRREGHWLLETEEADLEPAAAVRAYQDLWRVEAAFRTMKDVLELRPVWHRTASRVQAHVLVATLALALDRVLERKLRKARLGLSPRAVWRALEGVSLVEFEQPGGKVKAGVCVNGAGPRRILHALGVPLEVPAAPEEGEREVH